MAYTSAYLTMISPGGSKCARIWSLYTDTVFASTTATDFITDASAKGMQVNDVVHVFSDASDVTTFALAKSTATKYRPMRVSAIDADGNGTLAAVSTS